VEVEALVIAVVTRRVGLTAILAAVFSFLSFYFFADTLPPLKGKPPVHEYWLWVHGLFTGRSYESLTLIPYRSTAGASLWPIVLPALAHTAILLAAAIVLVVAFSVAMAYAGARLRRSTLDLLLRGLAYLGWAVPAFLLGLLVQLVVSTIGGSRGIGPFPLAGWPGSCPASIGLNAGVITPCPAAGSGAALVYHVLTHVTLPAATLAAGFIGLHGRYLRSALVEQLDAPYVTTARMKGLNERRVILRHALRNAMATFVSALFSDFGGIFGAALAVDWVFQLNGLGSLLIHEFPQSFAPADVYAIELILILSGGFVLVSSLVGDIAVAGLDPRARRER